MEFTSLFAFTVGFMFGSIMGAFFGSFIMFVNGFLSPWGFGGLNMPFQMCGMGIIGAVGGLYRKHLQIPRMTNFYAEVAVSGAVLTVVYDFITNFGVAISYIIAGMNPTLAVITAIGYGAPFSLIHVGSNIAVFGIAFFPLIKALNQISVVKNIG